MAPREGNRCEARDVLLQLEAMLAMLCKGAAEVKLEIAPGPAWASISRTDLERVVFNLVLNARDAFAGYGHIRLRLSSSAEQLVIEVHDDGQGISQELLVQVFQPYYTTKTQGTGLGLATVRNLVEGAGGHITVTSKLGQGSSFIVTLPRAVPAVAAGEGTQGPASSAVVDPKVMTGRKG
jgi:signal transduction histidine kinase